MASSSSITLKDMIPAAENNINTRFILLEKRNTSTRTMGSQGKQNRACLALVADETAAVHFQLWGEECDAFEAGDIIRLTNGIFSYDRSKQVVLRAGKRGKAEKVGEFTLAFVETPNMSEILWGRDPNNPKRLVQETVISPYSRIFPPHQ
ncbi:SOSS complex subunit B homolog [Telopea speciosissima]|uniref:SOSS complex subunit B homolog n=1 Tax=Telopea speciosissima TaxID=54955 RepID=UPI001CC807F4|nr:SOSS complex subunit B homolog [Telopea speciosissima]